jgi:leader peptidase (prepilin peptidase)/N-methyltransferase
MLRGSCRFCRKPISSLYPSIELITAISFFLLIQRTNPLYWPAYMLFFSALIVSIRTDLETMLISQLATIFLIPCAFICSYFGLLPLSLGESFFGSASAFSCLFSVSYLYFLLAKRVGLGQGDIELLAFIGAFLGFVGWWITLLLASCTGTIFGIFMMIYSRKSLIGIKIPFGPFLAIGAMLYVLFQSYFLKFIYF